MNNLHKRMETSLKKKIKAINISYPNNYPQVEPQRRCPDIKKLISEFKYKNNVSINDAIVRFYRWTSRYY